MKDRKALMFIGVGFELFAFSVAGIIVGKEVDKYFGWSGGGTILTLFLCLLSWSIHFIHLLKRYMKDLEND